jgi:hypothetical protein
VEQLGFRAIIFTVDAGWESTRTLENRTPGTIPEGLRGYFMASGGLQDRNLSWNDIVWIRVSHITAPRHGKANSLTPGRVGDRN